MSLALEDHDGHNKGEELHITKGKNMTARQAGHDVQSAAVIKRGMTNAQTDLLPLRSHIRSTCRTAVRRMILRKPSASTFWLDLIDDQQ